MTAEDRSQTRDGTGGGSAHRDGSGAPAEEAGVRDPGVDDGDDRSTEGAPRLHRPARSGAAAAAGAVRAEAGGGSEPGAGDSFGTWLRRQREMREIDLREIADKTKISLRYLKAMEQDRFEVLPAPVFARGFLREYARYVGLNPDEVVNFYLSAHEEEDEDGEEEVETAPPPSRGPLTRGALVAVLVLLVIAVVVYVFVYQRNRSDQEEAAPPPIAPPVETTRPAEPEATEPLPEPEVPAAAPLVVTLDFTEQCWVEARVDDAEQVSRLFVAGESLRLEAEERVVLETLGNAGGVEVQVNGRPFAVAAGPSRTARNVVIDLAAAGVAPDAAGGADGAASEGGAESGAGREAP